MVRTPISFHLNGADCSVFVEGGSNLLDALRRRAGDLSPKYGCGQGTCGACSVRIDGELRLACLTLAETVAGAHVQTAAGLAAGPVLDPLQTAFIEGFAAQCGFCTSGMLMAAKTLLARNPRPDRQQVAEAISGNLCRCTGYEPIIDAVMVAADRKGVREA
jgi:carbon-monoxide dehydrogenase small subunit